MTNAQVALIEYDVAEDKIIKNEDGTCKKITNHDPGLLIVFISPILFLMVTQMLRPLKRKS